MFSRALETSFVITASLTICVASSATLALALPSVDEKSDRPETTIGTVPDEFSISGPPVFSPRGDRVAYTVVDASGGGRMQGGKEHWVVDGEVGPAFHYVDGMVFSDDGEELAWRAGKRTASDRERWQIFLDGKAQKSFDWVGPPQFVVVKKAKGKKPAKQVLAYRVGKDVRLRPDGAYTNGVFSALLGRKSIGYPVPGSMSFDPIAFGGLARRFAYSQSTAREATIVTGKKPRAKHVLVGEPIFSGDGKKLAYGTYDGNHWRVWVNEKVVGENHELIGPLAYGPRGQLAYGVAKGGKWSLHLGGKSVGPTDFDLVDRAPVFSENGKHVAFIANRGAQARDERFPPGLPMYRAGGQWHVVAGGVEGPGYAEVRHLTLDLEGVPAYAARTGEKWVMVYGEEKSRSFDALGPPQFSKEGVLSFGALDGRNLLWVGETSAGSEESAKR